MLTQSDKQRGFTLVEIIVTLVVVAILAGLAAPNLSIWIQNSRIRTTADAILNGLQMARAESVKRNTSVRFQLTDSLTSSCALSANSSNWVVSLNDVTGKCDTAPLAPAANAALDPTLAYIVQTRSSSEGSSGVTVAADQASFIFTSLGRIAPVPATALNIDISNPTVGACAAAGGFVKCLRITVSPGGQVRMCNPAMSINTSPQGC